MATLAVSMEETTKTPKVKATRTPMMETTRAPEVQSAKDRKVKAKTTKAPKVETKAPLDTTTMSASRIETVSAWPTTLSWDSVTPTTAPNGMRGPQHEVMSRMFPINHWENEMSRGPTVPNPIMMGAAGVIGGLVFSVVWCLWTGLALWLWKNGRSRQSNLETPPGARKTDVELNELSASCLVSPPTMTGLCNYNFSPARVINQEVGRTTETNTMVATDYNDKSGPRQPLTTFKPQQTLSDSN